jgi:hypothetical protein
MTRTARLIAAVRDQDRAGAEVVEAVHDLVHVGAGNHDADGDPLRVVQRRDRRRLEAGSDRCGLLEERDRAVVVEQHVLAGDQDALQPTEQDGDALRLPRGRHEHGRGVEDDRSEDLEARLAEGGAGLDDVGDHIGDAQLDRRLDRSIEADEGHLDAVLAEEGADEAGVARGDAQSVDLGELGVAAGRTGEAEGRVREAQTRDLAGLGARVDEQVAARHSDVEGAGADVRRDVARTEVEELDAVALVDDVQLLRVAAADVAGLGQHLAGGLGERALVGHGDAQQRGRGGGHGRTSSGARG